jgi:hypothetical protein
VRRHQTRRLVAVRRPDRYANNAKAGLTYSQWHTTALCSPTRSCFLTGRNHHQNGFAQIAEGAPGFPGHTGHVPMENATMAEVLRENGWMRLRRTQASQTARPSRNHPLGVRRLAIVSSMLWEDRLIGFADDSQIERTNSLWRH